MSDESPALQKAIDDFMTTALSLSWLLTDKLEREDPELYAKVNYAIANGERIQITMEYAPDRQAIIFGCVDDYQNSRPVMTLQGRPALKS